MLTPDSDVTMVLQTQLTRDQIREVYREKVAAQENNKRDEGRR